MLGENGVEIETACNGKEAVEQTERTSYDLIIMDLQMPVMDGFEATETIRRKNFRNPILAVSANINNDSIVRCKQVGMNDFLQKPFQKHQLVSFVERWTE